jgi:hypothetical protein
MAEREVTVGLVDLKILVEKMFDDDVQRRAEIMVLNQPGHSDASAALEFAALVEDEKPKARKAVELRYRRLREALENGTHVAQSLKAFLHRG